MSVSLAAAGLATFTSCEDMLDKGNSYVIYADTEHLTSSADTVTSVVGILNKLQAIAVRNNLLGEVRADLVDVKENAIVDLKNLALLDADVTGKDDENSFNNPRDYYAVINNCNYFLDRVNDSLPEIHTDAMKYMFEREVAAVHGMRAWTYLQCVLAYGKVPFVDKPVLTEAESKKEHPMYGIEDICDYFIADLIPYVNTALPDYNSFDNKNVTPKMCFFPINLILGDLYLWKAAIAHDAEAAKKSAMYYYDFIEWDKSGKKRTTTGTNRIYWSPRELSDMTDANPLRSTSGSMGFGTNGTWGGASTECITAIAMDSSSAMGYYNELRNMYNSQQRPELKEACIVPSEALKQLSQSQVYVGFNEDEDTVTVRAIDMHEDAVENFMVGDLRFSYVYNTRDQEYNEKEIKMQTIAKHSSMNVMVYRVQQVYLRLAEALNYAGYPRFAKQILTMGVNRTVIENEVQPYYTSPEDSTFLNYFEFNDSFFQPYAASYTTAYDEDYKRIPVKISPTLLTSQEMQKCNMWGIHGRGAGIPFKNESYLSLLPVDSTYAAYPEAEKNAIGEEPILAEYQKLFPTKPTNKAKKVDMPSSWEQYGDRMLTYEEYIAQDAIKNQSENRKGTLYKRYSENDSVGLYKKFLDDTATFEAEMAAYSADTAVIMTEYREVMAAFDARVDIYVDAWYEWHGKIYSNPAYIQAEQDQVDQAILDEQALELAYEGNRYYDLMRRAFWYGDPKRLNDPISAARPEVAGKLLDKKNWFLHYKGQIGY